MALAAVILLLIRLAVVTLAWYSVKQAKGVSGKAKVGFRIAGIHFTYETGDTSPDGDRSAEQDKEAPSKPIPPEVDDSRRKQPRLGSRSRKGGEAT